MELEDLKTTWNSENFSSHQQNLNAQTLKELIQHKYNSKIRRIAFPEIMGSIVCLAAFVFIAFHFYQLDTLWLQGAGITSLLVLIAIPVLSFCSLRQLSKPKDFNLPHTETLKRFASQTLMFDKLQKVNITLGYLLLVTIIVLTWKFFGGKDLVGNTLFWIVSFTFGYLFLLFFSRYVTRHYKRTLAQTEELLQELQS